MKTKILSLLITLILSIFFTACGNEELKNEPFTVDDFSTLEANLTSISLFMDDLITIEVISRKKDGTPDTISIIESNETIYDINISDTNTSDIDNLDVFKVSVSAKMIGAGTLTIENSSGSTLDIAVDILEHTYPTLTLDKSSLNMDVGSSNIISVESTTDGTTKDTIFVTASDTDVISISVIDNNISITSLSAGESNITVTSGSELNVTCLVSVNNVIVNEDPNEYLNDTNSSAYLISATQSIVDIVSSKDDWYSFDVIENINYDIQLKKFIDNGEVEAFIYSDVNQIPLFSIITNSENALESVVHTFVSDINSTFYVRVKNNNVDVTSIEYELKFAQSIDENMLVADGNWRESTINDDQNLTYYFDAEYGKKYDIYVSDGYSHKWDELYDLDVIITAYTEDMNQIYFDKIDHINYQTPETLNPVKSEKVFIKIAPKDSSKRGDFAIKIIENVSYSDGMKNVKFPLEDSVLYKGKVGKQIDIDNWSYYSTNAINGVSKSIVINNISPAENIYIKIYEDELCTTEVKSVSSNDTAIAMYTYEYTKSGDFCIGVNNQSLLNNATYDIQVSGNKAVGSTTYKSLVAEFIPDNNETGVLSNIVVEYGIDTISKISVNVNIIHSSTADLALSLITPENDEILLSQNNGITGSKDYNNTTFADDANISINDVSVTAPFTGTYIPTESLSIVNDYYTPDGNWSLKVVDSNINDTGLIYSWSLTVE